MLVAWFVWRAPELRREIAALEMGPALATASERVIRAATALVAAVPDIAELALPPAPVRSSRPRVVRLALAIPAPDAETTVGGSVQLGIAPTIFTDSVAVTAGGPIARPVDRDRAGEAYALLAAGDRRAAANAFREALAAAGSDARAAAWSRELGALNKRWSGWAYVYLRESGVGDPSAAPVLGGGQSAAQLSYTFDPLAMRPLAAQLRFAVANSDRDSAELAAGLSWRPVPALSLAVERRVALGRAARDAWNFRIAGGYDRPARAAGHWRDLSIYGEAGMVGLHRQDLYTAAIVRGGERFALGASGATLMAGAGVWASVQRSDSMVSRFELGPTARLHLTRPVPLDVIADYRFRTGGNAAPGSGPVVTIATGF